MLGILLDTMVLVILIKAIAEHEEDDFIRPGIIALIASVALLAAGIGISQMESGALLALIGAIIAVGLLVGACCFVILGIDRKNSMIIGGVFIAYKVGFSLFYSFLFSGG